MTKTVTSSRKSRGCVSFFMAQASLESLGVVSTGESLVEKNLIRLNGGDETNVRCIQNIICTVRFVQKVSDKDIEYSIAIEWRTT